MKATKNEVFFIRKQKGHKYVGVITGEGPGHQHPYQGHSPNDLAAPQHPPSLKALASNTYAWGIFIDQNPISLAQNCTMIMLSKIAVVTPSNT